MKLIRKAGKTKLIISKKEYDEINKKADFVNRELVKPLKNINLMV
jgi:uncharacterized coiled-coil DUF342 family protein